MSSRQCLSRFAYQRLSYPVFLQNPLFGNFGGISGEIGPIVVSQTVWHVNEPPFG
jgi:hypothetical protein